MHDLLQEIGQSARALRRAPGYTIAAILTLGTALGATIAAGSVLHAVLWRGLPLRDPSRLVAISLTTSDNDRYPLSIPDLLEYRERARTLDGLAAVAGQSLNLTGDGLEAERLQGVRASGDFFPLLGVEAQLGRTLDPQDDERGDKVAVITDGLWRRRFGADPSILGQAMRLNGEPHTVVGILPPFFRFPVASAEVAVPLAAGRDPVRQDRRATGMLRAVGRLRDGVTLAACRAELGAIARRLKEEFPDANSSKNGVSVTPVLDEVIGPVRSTLGILAGAIGCVLLVACANLSGLALVRMSGRSRELAVRAALGAGRARLARLALFEGLLLALAGGALGVALAFWGMQGIAALGPRLLPRAHEVGFDLFSLLFAAGVATASGLGCGLVPAILAGRVDLLSGLKGEGGAASSGRARPLARLFGRNALHRSRRLLVAAEMALAMLLLAGAGLLLRSFARLVDVDPGFETRAVLVARLALPKGTYGRPEAMVRFHDDLLGRLRALPGVVSAGMISIAPMSGPLATADVRREDGPAEPEGPVESHYRVVSPDYFRTMGIRLVRGRPFTDADRGSGPPVGIVNETLARRLFPGDEAIGRGLVVGDRPAGARRVTIVGVVSDVRHEGLDQAPAADLHLPIGQVIPEIAPWLANNQFWSVRASGNPALLARAVRECVRAVDPEVSAGGFRTPAEIVAEGSAMRRLTLLLVLGFAAVALLLAAMGLYGVVAFAVRQRRREIGIRMALGARGGEVERLVASEGLWLAGVGLGAGLLAALASARFLAGLLFEIPPHDPPTFAAVALTLGATALLASWLPARAATRIPPTEALRGD